MIRKIVEFLIEVYSPRKAIKGLKETFKSDPAGVLFFIIPVFYILPFGMIFIWIYNNFIWPLIFGTGN